MHKTVFRDRHRTSQEEKQKKNQKKSENPRLFVKGFVIVVHDALVVVLCAQMGDGVQVLLFELVVCIIQDVLVLHSDEVVPIVATLLVEEACCVHQFVHDDAFLETTIVKEVLSHHFCRNV